MAHREIVADNSANGNLQEVHTAQPLKESNWEVDFGIISQMEITLIKLGGSLITDKGRPYTARPWTIRRLAKEIKRAIKGNSKLRLIIGNGGGSFPHVSATKYGTANGYSGDEGKLGFCQVQNDAATINRLCVKIFLEEGIGTISVTPNNIFLTSNAKIANFYIKNIEALLINGIIPFVYGDTLIDTVRGSCIYSCDQIMETLSQTLPQSKYKVNKIISVGDFPGVLDAQNSVVPLLNHQVFKRLIETRAIKKPSETDVTGGMKAKIETLLTEAKNGIESIILDGRKPDNLYRTLMGKSFLGTTVKN